MRISNEQPECLNCGKVPSLAAGHGGIPICIREPAHEGLHNWEFRLQLDDASGSASAGRARASAAALLIQRTGTKAASLRALGPDR